MSIEKVHSINTNFLAFEFLVHSKISISLYRVCAVILICLVTTHEVSTLGWTIIHFNT